jgi:hypothetical protein
MMMQFHKIVSIMKKLIEVGKQYQFELIEELIYKYFIEN